MSEFDDATLSAYLDGELDRPTMREIEAYLDQNTEARRHVLDALHATVLLRASGRRVMDEPVPAALENILKTPRRAIVDRLWSRPFRRPAKALAALVLGIGMGWMMRPTPPDIAPGGFPALPAAYLQAVNESLENHLSGVPFIFESAVPGERIVVTPTRTYRNRRGQYYRDYRLELHTGEDHRQLRGLALRTGKSQWETTAIYYNHKNRQL